MTNSYAQAVDEASGFRWWQVLLAVITRPTKGSFMTDNLPAKAHQRSGSEKNSPIF